MSEFEHWEIIWRLRRAERRPTIANVQASMTSDNFIKVYKAKKYVCTSEDIA